VELPTIILLGFWFLMQLFSAGAIAATAADAGRGGVAFMAHAAGFAAGALVVLALGRRAAEDARWSPDRD
jgi:membrane associated rhomboid family serine protease